MSKGNNSLKQADRKIFRASFDDGLVDIFISSVVLMFAVAPLLSRSLGDFWSSAIFLPLWGILYIVLRWIRVHVINPRKGVVKYGPQRWRKLNLFAWIMLIVNTAFLLLGLVIGFVFPSNPGWTVLLPFSVMVLALFSLAGFFLEINRFFVYGLMLAAGPFIGEWLFQKYKVPHHAYPVILGSVQRQSVLPVWSDYSPFSRDNPLPREEQLKWEPDNG